MKTEISEKPIPFSAPMVRAILDGRKSMTRRVVKGPIPDIDQNPYGWPGDRLWIKTGYTTRYDPDRNETHWETEGGWITTHGQAISKTGKPKRNGGHPGMFMPKWLSMEFRLPLLEITDVRVERLQEISEADARAEGFLPVIRSQDFDPAVEQFATLWDQLNGPRGFGWESNPWVWVIEFKRIN